MTQGLPLKQGTIYGPVNSRRLGRSLGINLSPTKTKICPFDCLYCHYGTTKTRALDLTAYRKLFPTPEDVGEALKRALTPEIAPMYVTFSGNGEPTAHPDFLGIVEVVRLIVSEQAPQAQLAILSNSALVHQPQVIEGLDKIDVPIMKLDAGNPEVFAQMNRPAPEIEFVAIVDGLARMKRVTIQTLFATGAADNSSDAAVDDWLNYLRKIGPQQVQIYTCDRVTAEEKLQRLPRERMSEIATWAQGILGVPVTAF